MNEKDELQIRIVLKGKVKLDFKDIQDYYGFTTYAETVRHLVLEERKRILAEKERRAIFDKSE